MPPPLKWAYSKGFTDSKGYKDNIYNGFTLAEVLITLGIIGVVAAMTLPGLIAKHRKTVIETKLARFLQYDESGFTNGKIRLRRS